MYTVALRKIEKRLSKKRYVPLQSERVAGGYLVLHPTKGFRRISERRLALKRGQFEPQTAGAAGAWARHSLLRAIETNIQQQEGY